MTFDEAMQIYAYDGILHLASANRHETLAKILAVPFDPKLHYPLIYLHLHYAMLEIAQKMLENVPNKEDETYKQLQDFYDALAECEKYYIGLFPLSISYRKWWDGPHLNFPETYNEQKLTAWYPLRINYVENDKVYVDIGIKEENKIKYANFELEAKNFEKIEENAMGEIAFYGEDFLVKLHDISKWIHTPELQILQDVIQPYISKSNELFIKQIDGRRKK